jgi:hypothetical protein
MNVLAARTLAFSFRAWSRESGSDADAAKLVALLFVFAILPSPRLYCSSLDVSLSPYLP